ncbi:MAG: phosphatidylserine decarboxylase family protein [Bacteroidetes bacterium]|nr:phosphatidylserine decarboxylase family protein [Bacteroidota bacterium]
MIHREGSRILIVALVVLVALNLCTGYYFGSCSAVFLSLLFISAIKYSFLLFFFRNPQRHLTRNGELIISPADGKIVAIETVHEDEYFKDKRIQVSVFMSPLNVHLNRYPVSGVISYFKYHKGRYLMAYLPKSSVENERTTIVINNGYFTLLVRQIAGGIARRIVTYCRTGDKVLQGDEMGFIKFGSRVDILLPDNTKIMVNLGDKVKGGVSVIGKLTNETVSGRQ